MRLEIRKEVLDKIAHTVLHIVYNGKKKGTGIHLSRFGWFKLFQECHKDDGMRINFVEMQR